MLTAFNLGINFAEQIQVEHVEQDKEKAASSSNKFGKLEWIQERMRDDFAANQALRRSFKVFIFRKLGHQFLLVFILYTLMSYSFYSISFQSAKAVLNEERVRDEDLLKRMSLNIKLVSESMEDKRLAAAVLQHKNLKFT